MHQTRHLTFGSRPSFCRHKYRHHRREPRRCASHDTRPFIGLSLHRLAHQTASGCGLRTGNVFATGTISGPQDGSAGCLSETTHSGQKAFEVTLDDKSKARRMYLEDGDTIWTTGQAVHRDGTLAGVGLGECVGTIVPNLTLGACL
jgi:fumarylacetoacetase